MTLNSSNVAIAVTGAVSVGGDTFVAPTAHDSALTNAVDLGYVSEDGITEARSRDTESITAWQNGDTVRVSITGSSMTFQCVFLESKKETVETYYGTTVDTDDGSWVVVPSQTGGRKPFVFDYVDGDRSIRAYAPLGEVTETGDKVYANGQPIGYDCTITCYPSSTIQDDDGNNGSVKFWDSALIVEP